MPLQRHDAFTPTNGQYGFFTLENGSSDGGYVTNDTPARNVNLYSPDQKESGYDPASNVIANLMACFKELTNGQEANATKMVMTSHYAEGGIKVLSCADASDLTKHLDAMRTSDELAKLKLHPEMSKALVDNNVAVFKADAFVFKNIGEQKIVVGGPSADAHPIIIIDDVNKVYAYISGAHKALSSGVIENSLEAMITMGATPENIHIVIGPGLGPKSYEFGTNAETYFGVPDAITKVQKITITKNADGEEEKKVEEKRLVDIEKVIKEKARAYVNPDCVHNLEIDTQGFDLYEPNSEGVLTRKTNNDLPTLISQCRDHLFSGARRTMIIQQNNIDAQKPEAHATVPRHLAGVWG